MLYFEYIVYMNIWIFR